MLKSGFEPGTIACKIWNPNGSLHLSDIPSSASGCKTVGTFKTTPATKAISAYFKILLFLSQIKFQAYGPK